MTEMINDLTSTANAVTGVYGLSGSGKSRQMDEAARDVANRHHLITRMVVPDLGGWGNSRQSLIDLGIVQVWYPCNHIAPFATMELASLGYWPESFIDPAIGLTAEDVALVAPQQTRWTMYCKDGHPAFTSHSPREIAGWAGECPTCKAVTSDKTCLRIGKVVVQSKGFSRVGLRGFDSMTQLNEWGLSDRANEGAQIKEKDSDASMRSALAVESELPEGKFVFGSNSMTHFGFLQNRSRGWIQNIRAIPNQVERAILTFGVECSKGDDESGGVPVYGPKIAGNARTSSVPGWLGNCFHLEKDPSEHGRFRIWLTNHVDPRDPRAIPYLAKHRGEPGLPNFLEDAVQEAPFTTCSLRKFYELERQQLAQVRVKDQELQKLMAVGEETEVVLQEVDRADITARPSGPVASATTTAAIAGGANAQAVGTVRRRGAAARPMPQVPPPTPPGLVETPSIIAQQLKNSLAAQAPPTGNGTDKSAETTDQTAPPAAMTPPAFTTAALTPGTPVAAAGGAAAPAPLPLASRVIRRPRPPV